MGSEGRQFSCYTVVKNKYWPPKVPSGGNFGCEKYTLAYLYEEYKFGNNIWTKTNISKEPLQILVYQINILQTSRNRLYSFLYQTTSI